MSHPGQIITRKAQSAIGERLIVAVGSELGSVTQGTASNALIGVCAQPGGCASGTSCDVMESGIAEVVFGGSVNAGDIVGSDANGKAVAVTSGRALGVALCGGSSGDIGEVRILPFTIGSLDSSAVERIAALETSVDTAETGLLARVSAIEAAINTESTGILARLTALETVEAGT